jgi:outer membrane protein OmpA-like peptidoglycan-associated protein
MIRFLLGLAVLALVSVPAGAEWNEPHVEGTKPHAFMKLYPQARVSEYSQRDFDGVELVVGYKRGADDPVVQETIEGRVTQYKYEHKPQTSPLEIVRNYENVLKPQGFVTVVAGRETQFPGVPTGLNGAFGAFRLDRNGTPAAWVNVSAYQGQGPEDPFSDVTIVEIKAMEQKLEANAGSMLQDLQRSGRVAVYGITFDTGKSTIKPDSDKVLGEVLKLVQQNPTLKLRIEGHTDNVGGAAANRKLSEDRAQAVRNWLVQKGVRAANLSAAGFGDAKPVADNGSEDGRSRNRRVELVRQ